MARKKKRLAERLEAATRSRVEAVAPPSFAPSDDDDLPVELAAFVGAALIGLLIIMGFAIFYGVGTIESRLEAQTLGLLRANGIRDIEVDADGLGLTLVGTVREERHVALALAIGHSIEGVVDVDVQNVIYVPPRAEIDVEILIQPLVFSWTEAGVAVSGTVSNQATLEVVIAAARDTWTAVDHSDLVVEPEMNPERDWLPSVLQVVAKAGEDLSQGLVIANSESSFVLVNGELETRSEQLAIRREIEGILSALAFEFTNGLTVKQQPPPPTSPPVLGSGTTAPSTSTTLAPEVIDLQETLDDLIEGKVVEFDFASAVITGEGRDLLDEMLDALRKFPEVPVQITGHTDDVGTEESNLLLSRLRAAAVLSYLVDNGENASRFLVIGLGETQPIADNATAGRRARNRRIDFTALSE